MMSCAARSPQFGPRVDERFSRISISSASIHPQRWGYRIVSVRQVPLTSRSIFCNCGRTFMSSISSNLPIRVIRSYWAEVRRLLQIRFALSKTAASRAVESYQKAIADVGVRDEIYHASVDETAKGIVEGGYAAAIEVRKATKVEGSTKKLRRRSDTRFTLRTADQARSSQDARRFFLWCLHCLPSPKIARETPCVVGFATCRSFCSSFCHGD